MKKPTVFAYILIASCLLSACGTVHNRSDDYLSAKNDPALKLPAGTSDASFKDDYPIPSTTAKDVQPVSLVPPGLTDDQKAASDYLAAQKEAEKKKKATASA